MGEILYHPFITAPLVFFALAFIPSQSKYSTILNISIVALYIFILYKTVSWPDYGSYYLKYFYLLIFIVACIKPIKKFKKLSTFKGKVTLKWLFRFFSLIKILVLFLFAFVIVKFYSTPLTKEIVNIEFPLK